MATAGSIVVDLLARTGAFDTDIQRSTKAAEKRMKEMERTFNDVGVKIGATFGAFLSVAAIRGLLNGVDALNDLSDATGASIENLSALENIAARTGTSFDTVGNAVVKFNQSLKGTDPDSKAGRALEMLGLRMEDLQKMDPAEALHKTARALAGFADDGNKARIVQELFGKSTKEVAAFLKDLADQSALVATVTTEEAKEAEAFNQQLSQMAKNSKDLARSIAGDLLPELNALLKAWREAGTLGSLMALGGAAIGIGGGDPGQQLNVISEKLRNLKKQLSDIQSLPNGVRSINEAIWGDEADLTRQIGLLEKEQRFLKSLQASAALGGGGDTSDALSRRLGSRPALGTLTDKDKKGPKGPDPDADFKAYLNNLEQQIQKVGELTAMEKLLDDIRRGHLTVSPKQEAQLKALAGQIDAEKEALRIAKERQAQRNKDYEDAAAGLRDIDEATRRFNEDQKVRLDQLTGVTALKEQWSDLQLISKAFEAGTITGYQFDQALESIYGKTQKISRDAEDFASIGLDALQQLAIGGENFNDVLKRTLISIANLIYQIGVVEPLMAEVRAGAKAGTGFGGFLSGIGSLLTGGGGVNMGTATGADLGLFYAEGGPVSANKPIIVGDGGEPEWFIPRTAGMIVPMSKASSEGGHTTIVNQTTGRVDNVVEQRISPRERVLFLQEARAAIAADIHNANSPVSEAMRRNYGLQRTR